MPLIYEEERFPSGVQRRGQEVPPRRSVPIYEDDGSIDTYLTLIKVTTISCSK